MLANILYGKNEPLLFKETNIPIYKPDEVLIQLHASAFNRRDYWIQQGQYAGLRYPVIPGSDGSGLITQIGESVAPILKGKAVIINPGFFWGENEKAQSPKTFKILGMPDNGTFAEYVSVPAAYVYPKPPHLTHIQAAALPLAGVTAYRALFTRAALLSGEKLLITGVGGGVALTALQFAIAVGAEVWVTSSSQEKITKACELGAKGGVSYKEPDWAEKLKKSSGEFDVILDSAGGEGFVELLNLAAYGGRISIYGGTIGTIPALSPQKIFWKQLSILGSTMGTQSDFQEMVHFVNKFRIIPIVENTLPLSEAETGMKIIKNTNQTGKIVLDHQQ